MNSFTSYRGTGKEEITEMCPNIRKGPLWCYYQVTYGHAA